VTVAASPPKSAPLTRLLTGGAAAAEERPDKRLAKPRLLTHLLLRLRRGPCLLTGGAGWPANGSPGTAASHVASSRSCRVPPRTEAPW
jgi:hypothetical protein